MATRMEDAPTTIELPVGSPATTAGWPVYWSAAFVGAVLGGWLGSGETMNPSHHFRRPSHATRH